MIKSAVAKFTDKEISNIADSCAGLRSLDNKKRESRREFVSNFTEYHDLYKKVVNTFEDLSDEIKANGDTKKGSLAFYVQLIRDREVKLGKESYLLNEAKFGFMKSIAKWVFTPGELDKTSKSQDEAKKDKPSKSKKKISTRKNQILFIKLQNKSSNNSSWEVELVITNISDNPLQNVDLSLYDTDGEKFSLSEAEGDFISINKKEDSVRIAFMPASMDENNREEKTYTLKGPTSLDIERLTSIHAEVDNPGKGEKDLEIINLD